MTIIAIIIKINGLQCGVECGDSIVYKACGKEVLRKLSFPVICDQEQ